MKVAELARQSGFTVGAINQYEARALLSSRRDLHGHRVYDESHLAVLALIRQAKQLDLPLRSIDVIVRARDSAHAGSLSAEHRRILEQHGREAGQRIDDLTLLQASIAEALAVGMLGRTGDATLVANDSRMLPARRAAWRDLFRAASRTEVPGGLKVRLPIRDLTEAVSLTSVEQACDASFHVTMVLRARTFDIICTAPRSHQAQLADLLGG